MANTKIPGRLLGTSGIGAITSDLSISKSDPILNIARTGNYTYKIGSLANDTFVIQSNETGDASYKPLIEIDSYAHQGGVFLKGDSDGKLGVGATTPTEKVTVNGALAVTGFVSSNPANSGTLSYDLTSFETVLSSYAADATADGSIAFKTGYGGAAPTTRMAVTSGGIGIGTDITDGELHVKSTGNADVFVERTSGAKIHLQAQSALGNIGTSSNHDLGLMTNASVRMRIKNNGIVQIGSATAYAAGAAVLHLHQPDATSNSYLHLTHQDTGSTSSDGMSIGLLDNGANAVIRLRENGYLKFWTNNTEAMLIDDYGTLNVKTDQSTLSSGKYDQKWGGGSKSHGSFLAPYMTLSTRYGSWDANIGCNARSYVGQQSGGLEQATAYGGGGASNLMVGFTTLKWYHYPSSVTNTLGTALPINSTYLYMQASASGFNIKGSYASNASDRRLKDDIKPITNALDKVKQLTGNTFTWKTTIPASGEPIPEHKAGKEDMGVIAQEVQEVVPSAVLLSPWDAEVKEIDNPDFDGDVETSGPQKISDSKGFTSVTGENYLTVNEEKLVPLLIEAIKELSTEVEELKAKLEV